MRTAERFPALWLLPVLIPVAAFTIFPVAHALWTSLHQVMLLFPEEEWVGLDNYKECRHRPLFPGGAEELADLHHLLGARRGRSRNRDCDLPEPIVLRRHRAPLDHPHSLGAARSNQRRALGLGVPSELGGDQFGALRDRSDRPVDPVAEQSATGAPVGDRRACLDADSVHRRPDDGDAIDTQPRTDGGREDRRRKPLAEFPLRRLPAHQGDRRRASASTTRSPPSRATTSSTQ